MPLEVELAGAAAVQIRVADDVEALRRAGLLIWQQARVELMDGRVLRLVDLPVVTLD